MLRNLAEELLYDNELRLDDSGTRELRHMHLQTADMRMPAYKAKNWDLYALGLLSLAGFVCLTGVTGSLMWSYRDSTNARFHKAALTSWTWVKTYVKIC